MKLAVIIVDGMAEGDALFDGNISSYAKSLSSLSRGLIETIPRGYSPETKPCVLNIMGAETSSLELGRSYFEGLCVGAVPKRDEGIFRLNLCQIDEYGRLCSFNGGCLSDYEMERIFEEISKSFPFVFPLSCYRAVGILEQTVLGESPLSLAPHDNLGKGYDALIQENIGDNENFLAIISKINSFLSSLVASRSSYLRIFPYARAEAREIKPFSKLYGKSPALIADFETVVGIGKALSFDFPRQSSLPKTLEEKRELFFDALDGDNKIIFLHINDLDEISHKKDRQGKIDFLSEINDKIFSPIISEERLYTLILPDHISSSKSGTHKFGKVPYFTNLPLSRELTIDMLHKIYKQI